MGVWVWVYVSLPAKSRSRHDRRPVKINAARDSKQGEGGAIICGGRRLSSAPRDLKGVLYGNYAIQFAHAHSLHNSNYTFCVVFHFQNTGSI